MVEIDNVIHLNNFNNLRSLEEVFYDVFEGKLLLDDRKVKLIIHGERSGVEFYRAITHPNSGWIVRMELKEGSFNKIDHWIAPNAVMVFPEIVKE